MQMMNISSTRRYKYIISVLIQSTIKILNALLEYFKKRFDGECSMNWNKLNPHSSPVQNPVQSW